MSCWTLSQAVRGMAVLAGAVLCAGAGSASDRLVAQASFGGATYLLEEVGSQGQVRTPDGLAKLASEVRAYALAATVEGWVATAVAPSRGGARLALFTADPQLRRVEGPPASAVVQASPQPVMAGGEWRGLLWLEGGDERSLGVRMAERRGGEFTDAVWVAPPGGSPILAPEVTVLADGSWLAVWSSVAGGDEDIFYSWRAGGAWTAPRRVHADNSVPDVTPALTAQGLGAIAAWGRFDGESYRVRTSRFAQGAWVDSGWLSAAPGAHPYFVGEPDSRALVLPVSGSDAWALYAVDDAGLEALGQWSHASSIRPVARRLGGRWNLEFAP
ncbi:MAG: hypothetical protein VYE73_00665 [Acidobacteriota bacterium]|nr:hypothetical protein [Acidobacteriota bacterium]